MIIYKATNLINGKVYIGQTTQKLSDRKYCHLRKSKSAEWKWKGYFHRSIKKYGEDNFKWEIIDNTDNFEDLQRLEIFWISFYNSTNKYRGYNLMSGGRQGRHSSETKKKISEIQKGVKKISEKRKAELREEMKGEGNPFYGKKHSEETRKKISKSRKGKGLGQTDLQKIKCPHLGESNGRAIVTRSQVVEIKKCLKLGMRNRDIQIKFSISKSILQGIKFERTWRHVKID